MIQGKCFFSDFQRLGGMSSSIRDSCLLFDLCCIHGYKTFATWHSRHPNICLLKTGSSHSLSIQLHALARKCYRTCTAGSVHSDILIIFHCYSWLTIKVFTRRAISLSCCHSKPSQPQVPWRDPSQTEECGHRINPASNDPSGKRSGARRRSWCLCGKATDVYIPRCHLWNLGVNEFQIASQPLLHFPVLAFTLWSAQPWRRWITVFRFSSTTRDFTGCQPCNVASPVQTEERLDMPVPVLTFTPKKGWASTSPLKDPELPACARPINSPIEEYGWDQLRLGFTHLALEV